MQAVSSDAQVNRHKVSWDEYNKDIRTLVKLIKKVKPEITGIMPIIRGGLVPATHLSHLLEVNRIHPYKPGVAHMGFYLIVDDVSDTGKTLIETTSQIKASFNPGVCEVYFKTATLYRKKHTKFEPDFCVKTINKWIVFPWEI